MEQVLTYPEHNVELLENLYLDYFNNFLTVEKFAEHHSMTVEQADEVIELGRAVNNFNL